MIHKVEGLDKIEVKPVDLLASLDGWDYKVAVYNKVSEGGAALKETMLLNGQFVYQRGWK